MPLGIKFRINDKLGDNIATTKTDKTIIFNSRKLFPSPQKLVKLQQTRTNVENHSIGSNKLALNLIVFIMMRQTQEQEDRYNRLLDYLRNMFKRENLCNNTYLFKQMHGSLTVPLQIVAEEKTVAQITRDYQLIVDALEHSGLVQIKDAKEVRIIEHPTVKINIKNHGALREIQRILQEKDVKYEISKRYDQDQYINLTVFSHNISWLEGLVKKIDSAIDFERVNLMEDIRFGVERIRKLKVDHAKKKTVLGKTRYNLQQPPEIFVRKAVQSSEQEDGQQESDQLHTKTNGNGNGIMQKKNGKSNGGGHRQKRYKEKVSKKPRLHQEDFPQLNL